MLAPRHGLVPGRRERPATGVARVRTAGGGGTIMTQFDIEHYEIIISAGLIAAAALATVSAFAFALVFGPRLLKRPATATRTAATPAPGPVVAEPARARPAVGAV